MPFKVYFISVGMTRNIPYFDKIFTVVFEQASLFKPFDLVKLTYYLIYINNITPQQIETKTGLCLYILYRGKKIANTKNWYSLLTQYLHHLHFYRTPYQLFHFQCSLSIWKALE